MVAANAEHIVALIAASTSHGAPEPPSSSAASSAASSPQQKHHHQQHGSASSKPAVSPEHLAAQADCYRILGNARYHLTACSYDKVRQTT